MSSRLFTEVREKRGLVYSINTNYHSLLQHAGMFTYAGTTPGRAQETLDVTAAEIRRLGEDLDAAELDRARSQLKSGTVMQGESTSARAMALVSDWRHLRRLRGLREIADAIDSVTADDLRQHLAEFPAAHFAVLVIGEEALNTDSIV